MNENYSRTDDRPVTILVVDDDPKITFVVSEFLEAVDYRVISCSCGTEALAAIEQRPIDLVLLDIIMPDIDGYVVAKRMKAFFGKDNFVPIIMLTGLTGINEKIAGLENADDVMCKPFSHRELLARIAGMLRIRSLHHELVVSRSRFQFLYENIPFLFATLDMHGIIKNCNTQFGRKYGLSKKEILGKSLESFFRKDDRPLLSQFVRSLKEGSSDEFQPVLCMVPPGESSEPIWVSLNGMYMKEGQNEYNVEIVMQDLTRNIKLEQEQRDARKKLYLSARLASIGTLAAGVAHELNNPLTAVLGFSNALLARLREDDKIDKDEFLQYLGFINTGTLRCRDIIENLSRFAREKEIRIAPFALKECVDQSLNLINARARKKNIAFTAAIPGSIIAKADSQRIEQVLVQVFSNSIDFCPPGSAVSVAATGDGDSVTLTITDNGPGIAPEIILKVFDPFFTTKEVGTGAGLGLAISHYIMEECNGAISVESEGRQGTSVVIEMPQG
jgi:two-component system, NtrC family, sensor kinase